VCIYIHTNIYYLFVTVYCALCFPPLSNLKVCLCVCVCVCVPLPPLLYLVLIFRREGVLPSLPFIHIDSIAPKETYYNIYIDLFARSLLLPFTSPLLLSLSLSHLPFPLPLPACPPPSFPPTLLLGSVRAHTHFSHTQTCTPYTGKVAQVLVPNTFFLAQIKPLCHVPNP
jgi:hypothetical protein